MIQKVDQMTQAPVQCVACGGNPMFDGKAQSAIDLGTDINYGDHAYLCIECAGVVADLMGRVPEEEHKALQHEYQKSERELAITSRKLRTANKKLKTVKSASKIVGA